MEIGIYPNISNEDYHSDPAISRSGVMRFLDCPYRYWAEYLKEDKPSREKYTTSTQFGNAFHEMILQPKLFSSNYVVKPNPVFKTKDGKEAYEVYKKLLVKFEKSGINILSSDDNDKLNQMKECLNQNDTAFGLIDQGKFETSFFWQDEHSGLMIKARPDILHSNMIVDLKTCSSASTRSFQHSMIEYGYHIQGAMVRDGLKILTGKEINTVINICIEKTYPYAIGIKIIGEDALEKGHQQYKQTLIDMKNCLDTNTWLSYDIETVNLPGWMK